MNVIELTQKLIQFPSETPHVTEVFDFLESYLQTIGFITERLPFEDVDNLYAKFGTQTPCFCFAGHLDVVPAKEGELWQHQPYAGTLDKTHLYGRGAADMKGAVAAFIAAAQAFIKTNPQVSIALLLTGDEEGPSINGTQKMLQHLSQKGETWDICLVGEPTNPNTLGEMIKIGRRGSLSGHLTVMGVEGHVAYPHLADNPCHKIIQLLTLLAQYKLDEGHEFFQPSSLQITSIDVGNQTGNIIPKFAEARFNIRFNAHHTRDTLKQALTQLLDQTGITYNIAWGGNGEAFYLAPTPFIERVQDIIQQKTGHKPVLSTSGGTSDARFIKDYCPVFEFGLVGKTMHKIDECVELSTLPQLQDIYFEILKAFFAG